MKRVGHFTNINQFTKKPTKEVRYMHTEKCTVVFLAKSKKQAEEICMAFNKVLKKKGIGGIQKILPKKQVTKKSKVKFYNINWDTYSKNVDLPNSVILTVTDNFNVEADGADLLSNKYGWCVLGFKYKLIKE
jgi:hypothetical protein